MPKTKAVRTGRPPHEPTDEKRSFVYTEASEGTDQKLICAQMRISENTLRKYYMEEWELGRADALSKLCKSAFKDALAGCVPTRIFMLKTQLGWRETHRIEHGGSVGLSVQAPQPLDGKSWDTAAGNYQKALDQPKLKSVK